MQTPAVQGMPKLLIVNADDLGLSRANNLAVATAHHHGILTSASLMTNMPAARQAVDEVVAAAPRLGVGLHLCLTSGRPVLPPARVPLLIDAWGSFRHSLAGLLRLLCSCRGAEALVQIRRELLAQARLAQRLGVRIDHVNGHQHIHVLPGVFAVAAKIAASHKVPLRMPDSPLMTGQCRPAAWLKWLYSGGLARKAVLARLLRKATAAADLPAVYRTQYCFGVVETGQLTRPALRAVLESLPGGSSELFTHPASPEAGGGTAGELACSLADRKFLHSPRRAAELEALVDPSLPGLLERHGITLATFGDLGLPATEKAACAAGVA